ncbi:MAG: TlpA family protein disulfide reductase [Phycisphaerales bacterium]|nr:TlpA family protein disulfide reductase [Phycisphaerales bacterium]
MATRASLIALAGASLIAFASAGYGQSRPPEKIISDIAALKQPMFDQGRREEQGYIDSFLQARKDYMRQRATLAKELYDADPESRQMGRLMTERWTFLTQEGDLDTVLAETEAVSKGDSQLALDAAYAHAQAVGEKSGWDLEKTIPAIDAFIARAPDGDRGARLLYDAASHVTDRDAQVGLYRRLIKDFPDSRTTKYVAGKIRQIEEVGKPFELSFQDAISGETVDLASRKGTIFVLDFWATWCGPCVAEMPHNKELYAQYKDKGVEFIGVSLDQAQDKGGLDSLKKFVAENDIPWPQYYQGNYWDSEFSTGWGVNSIPCLFVVDASGNLYSTEARGKLEEILPELIKRRDEKH